MHLQKIFFLAFLLLFFSACGTLNNGGEKNWTEQEVNAFLTDCNSNAVKLMDAEEAAAYCDCAVDKVARTYDSYQEAQKAPLLELRKVAKSCERTK